MPSRNGKTKHASLYDFRDLDLMLKIEERADEEGWSSTEDLASSMGFGDNLMPLAHRLSWMKRYGMVEFDQRHSIWRLTQGGLRVTEAKLRAAQQRTMEELPDELMVEVMSRVTQRYHLGDPMIATMLRREFQYGTGR